MAGDPNWHTCFVIMPFHTKPDRARKDEVNFDRVYSSIIKRSLAGLKDRGIHVRCIRCDEIERAGVIHERMIAQIAEADVAVVDITTQNPNVFYELGVRHAVRDRVTVLIRRKGTNNPFNIGGMTTIEYDLDATSAARARDAIANFVANGLLSGAKDSLVYSVLPGLRVSLEAKQIREERVEEYEIPRAAGKRIGIVAGNLRDVNLGASLRERPIDIWVSSENINMQMARPHDPSISGLIRYLGAKRDETGTILDDTVASELRGKMRRRQLVNPGEIVSTGAGALGRTHRVKRIYHAASVYGVVGAGYHAISRVEQCISNALVRADEEALGLFESLDQGKRVAAQPGGRAILFPLLAAGTARADVIQSARQQLAAAINYLRSRAGFTCVDRVYFLARDETVLQGLRVALAELGVTRPRPRGERARPSSGPPGRSRVSTKRVGSIRSRVDATETRPSAARR